MNNIIQVKNLAKSYNTLHGEIEVLKKINIDVKEGSFTSIVGSSGCGKSTLLNIIASLDKQDDGQIITKGKIKIGYMFQDDALLSYLTVYENAILGLKLSNNLSQENTNYVNHLLKEYGLDNFKNKYPNELSGGMKQKVACILSRQKKDQVNGL